MENLEKSSQILFEGSREDGADTPLPPNAYESLGFSRFIARQVLAHYAGRAGHVRVCKNAPNWKFFSDNVATKLSDVLAFGVIVDSKAKKYEQVECGVWNPQSYRTMMLPAKPEILVKHFLDPVKDDASEAYLELCGYLGMQPRLLDDMEPDAHRVSNLPFRLWRFHLLNPKNLRTILNFRLERAAARGKGEDCKLQLKAEDFERGSPYFLIALPTSFPPPFEIESPSESVTCTAARSEAASKELACRKRDLSLSSPLPENSESHLSGGGQEPAFKACRYTPSRHRRESFMAGCWGQPLAALLPRPAPTPWVPQSPVDGYESDQRLSGTEGVHEVPCPDLAPTPSCPEGDGSSLQPPLPSSAPCAEELAVRPLIQSCASGWTRVEWQLFGGSSEFAAWDDGFDSPAAELTIPL